MAKQTLVLCLDLAHHHNESTATTSRQVGSTPRMDRSQIVKYDSPGSLLQSVYVFLHVLISFGILRLASRALPVWTRPGIGGVFVFLLASLLSVGAVSNLRAWGLFVELGRLAAIVLAAPLFSDSGTVVVAARAIGLISVVAVVVIYRQAKEVDVYVEAADDPKAD